MGRCGYRRDHGSAATAGFLGDMVEMHESEHKFNVRKYNIQRLDESYRLVTIVLEKNKCGNLGFKSECYVYFKK
jgi:hypothetical protein